MPIHAVKNLYLIYIILRLLYIIELKKSGKRYNTYYSKNCYLWHLI